MNINNANYNIWHFISDEIVITSKSKLTRMQKISVATVGSETSPSLRQGEYWLIIGKLRMGSWPLPILGARTIHILGTADYASFGIRYHFRNQQKISGRRCQPTVSACIIAPKTPLCHGAIGHFR